ncbi:MAG: insulinase family protein [Bdellovibrionales bacterium]|nr:insulinase family protein [Bdellovibrionales bacterium]
MKAYSYQPIFQKTVLKNGVRVVTENHPFTRAVSAGIFVETGTRDEAPKKAGLTHFVEHMVFKGTRKRSSFDLAKVLDAVGGDLNAYTTREYTCFHATSLKEHLELGLDVLTDLATGATLTGEDFRTEREVIVQEIQMSKDNLEEYILDAYLEKTFEGQDLGTPILGTEETLAALKRADLHEHYATMFRGENLIVSVSGPVEHDQVVKMVERTLGKLPKRAKGKASKKPRVKRVQEFIERPSEQVHLLVGLPSCSYKSNHRFESFVVNDLLGGGVTSRFYQSVREDKGLVYTVYSFLQSFKDSGLFLTYAGASSKNAIQVLKAMKRELEKIRDKKGIREKELAMFKTQVKGQILLGAEDMENRMNSLGINEMIFHEYRPVDQVIAEIDEVSLRSISDYMQKYFDKQPVSLMVMGDLQPQEALKLLDVWE